MRALIKSNLWGGKCVFQWVSLSDNTTSMDYFIYKIVHVRPVQ